MIALKDLQSNLDVEVEKGEEWHSSGVNTGTGAVQHLHWQHGQRD